MREGHHQSDEHWYCFKGNIRKSFWEMGWFAWKHSDYFKHIDNIFNWTSCQICLLMRGHKQNRTELVVKCGSLKHGHGLNRTELASCQMWFTETWTQAEQHWTSCQICFIDTWTQTDRNWTSCQIWFTDAWTQTDWWCMDTDWLVMHGHWLVMHGHRLTGDAWTQTDRWCRDTDWPVMQGHRLTGLVYFPLQAVASDPLWPWHHLMSFTVIQLLLSRRLCSAQMNRENCCLASSLTSITW